MVNKKIDVIECSCDTRNLEIIKGVRKPDLVTIFAEDCVCSLRTSSGERTPFGTLKKDILITST